MVTPEKRKAAFFNAAFPMPKHLQNGKNFPARPRRSEKRNKFSPGKRRGLAGKFSEGRGGFGRGGTPLERGVPSPPKVFRSSHLARFGHGERIQKLVQQLVVNQFLLAHQILDAAVFA